MAKISDVLARTRAVLAASLLELGCAAGDDGSDVPDPCGPSDLYDEYLPGMTEVGQRMEVALDRAYPAPPEKGNNRWEIFVSDIDGEPVEALEIEVVPFMPDHGHGTSTDPTVVAGENPGDYEVDDIVFVMGGRWEITSTLDDGATEPEEVVFSLCIPD